jgi:hypothetical protein
MESQEHVSKMSYIDTTCIKKTQSICFSTEDFQTARIRLFERLLLYFPKHMKQPDESLIDAIRIV